MVNGLTAAAPACRSCAVLSHTGSTRTVPIPLFTVHGCWASWRAWLGTAPHTTFFVVLWDFHPASNLFTTSQRAVVANGRGQRANACDHQEAHQWHSTLQSLLAATCPQGLLEPSLSTCYILWLDAGQGTPSEARPPPNPFTGRGNTKWDEYCKKSMWVWGFSSELP